MATLTHEIQYKIHVLSQQIHDLKVSSFKTVKAPTYVYKHEDGRVKSYQDYKYPEDYQAGFRYSAAEYDKVVSCINPTHPDWQKYQALKAEASLWLTARCILKHFGCRPTKADLRKAIRDGRFGQHSPKRDHNALIFKAYGALSMVESSPEADYWVACKQQETHRC